MRTTILLAGAAIVSSVIPSDKGPLVIESQERTCLHGPSETPEERARREGAVAYLRVLNTAQARFNSGNKRFAELTELSGLPILAAGFSVQSATGNGGYLVALKDGNDPCHYSLFSDQAGLIFVGAPLQ